MNQKSLTTAMLVALIATVVTLVPQAFAQVVNNGGITEDDDTTNISSTPTKVKDSANCNISSFANECEQQSEAGIEVEE
jgi:pyridoxine 5'-phosphate synthase PdxJ